MKEKSQINWREGEKKGEQRDTTYHVHSHYNFVTQLAPVLMCLPHLQCLHLFCPNQIHTNCRIENLHWNIVRSLFASKKNYRSGGDRLSTSSFWENRLPSPILYLDLWSIEKLTSLELFNLHLILAQFNPKSSHPFRRPKVSSFVDRIEKEHHQRIPCHQNVCPIRIDMACFWITLQRYFCSYTCLWERFIKWMMLFYIITLPAFPSQNCKWEAVYYPECRSCMCTPVVPFVLESYLCQCPSPDHPNRLHLFRMMPVHIC